MVTVERGLAVLLITMGSLVWYHDGFADTPQAVQATSAISQGPVEELQPMRLPAWFGIGAMLLGGVLLIRLKPKHPSEN